MRESSDPKLIEFLTNDQNIGCALEILRHGDAIRAELNKRFWSALENQLKRTVPKNLSQGWKWSSGASSEKRQVYSWIDLQMPSFDDTAQGLFYRIEYLAEPGRFILYYGLHWNEVTQRSSKFLSALPVQNLHRLLEKEGYELTEQEWWYGWKEVRTFSGLDDFLSFFVENQEILFQAVSEEFWPFVEQTFNHVEKANRHLQA